MASCHANVSAGAHSSASRICKRPYRSFSTLGTKIPNLWFGRLRWNRSWKSCRAVGKRWRRFNPDALCHGAERRAIKLSSYFADTTLAPITSIVVLSNTRRRPPQSASFKSATVYRLRADHGQTGTSTHHRRRNKEWPLENLLIKGRRHAGCGFSICQSCVCSDAYVCAGCKRFSSSVPVSTVSAIACVFHERGITGISPRQFLMGSKT